MYVGALMALTTGSPAMAVTAEGTSQITSCMEESSFKRQEVVVKDGLMTPEVLWAMGRVGSYAASPNGKYVAYQVDYYSVEENKKQSLLFISGSKFQVSGSKTQLSTFNFQLPSFR